ncbi:Putative endoplasmic reticulum metallopeptidase 1 [Psilocybe cubensis]|uniref:Endoplasmic reticulum metallopeptidase 1 n=1 Tax=Psilocybe cubensis TaxID=181762 RepID=A0ACB8GUP6_PSICU|nr:Putative endoplasmic reticulum metallopeptidase 1 [Psilocybe cubensis]KAH9479296.1 Putative endoplasmic reticulum metallopeptidase 1 [Psilocybe cubensis]
MPSSIRWGAWRSIFMLTPVLVGAPWFAYQQHYKLPKPLSALTNPDTQLPQISEERILGVAQHLSEGIGFRTVGTYEHALADAWMVDAAEEVKKRCEEIVLETGRKLKCEVWHQEGSGGHRFDMMGKRLYKTYVNLTNIIVRISDGTPEGMEHAVLVNSHLDSTLPSPGAADDALAVGIMLDCMRVLIETPKWSPKHAIIFLFNHAEESLQDGSHLFSTQHPIASTVRAVINLEAAGTTGREILFQATSEQMIEAYSHVPRPYGTIFANDIFSSGVIITDFRQFELYLNVTGLDMAVVGNSYLYHMRKDLVENIEPGVAQHMGENTLALLRHLSSNGSPLPALTEGYTRPTTVFFAHVGPTFFMYSFTTAKIMYSVLFLASVILVRWTFVDPAPALKTGHGFWREQIKGLMAVLVGMVGTIAVPNAVAIIMKFALKKSMSWFKSPFAPIGLYGPPALLGAMASQYLIGEVHEQSVFTAMLLIQAFFAIALQMVNIGSAAMFFLIALPFFVALLLNLVFVGSNKRISLWTYAIGQLLPALTGSLLMFGVVEVFVPLTGRMGADAPADNIVAIIVSSLGALAFPLTLPFAHRFGKRTLYKGVVFMSMVTTLSIAYYATLEPFDEMHQKRLFIIRSENITTHEHYLHIAAADGAPGFESLVEAITKEFGGAGVQSVPVVMDDYNSDWDSLYPFSAFLAPYKLPLTVDADYVSPWVNEKQFTVTSVIHNENSIPGTRNITVHVSHPGLIWTAIAFDAHVLKWSLDNNPPDEYARHHIKEGSFYGHDTYSFDMVVKLQPGASPDDKDILVNFIGMQENGIWPAKKAVKAQGGVAMQLFENIDTWLDEKTGGKVDALLFGSVAGVSHI